MHPCKSIGHDVVKVGACIKDAWENIRGKSWEECMTCNPERAEEIGYNPPNNRDEEKI